MRKFKRNRLFLSLTIFVSGVLFISACIQTVVSVTVTPSSIVIAVGETEISTATSTQTGEVFTWTSADVNVARVDTQGNITGVAEGQTTVTATGNSSNASDSATVIVTPAVNLAVLGDFDATSRFLNDIPDDDVDSNTRQSLATLLNEAEALFRAEDSCGAADTLDEYLVETQILREDLAGIVGPAMIVGFAENLFAQGRSLQYDILANLPAVQLCPDHPEVGGEEVVEIPGLSDLTGVSTRFTFPVPRLQPVLMNDGLVFTQLAVPGGLVETGEPGTPGIPSVRRLIAIPPGGDVDIGNATFSETETIKVNLFPFQSQPVDQMQTDPTVTDQPPDFEVFANRPFMIDEDLYSTDGMYPPQPVAVTRLGRFRELELIQIEVFCGQYNPVSDELVLFDSVDAPVTFENKDQARGFITEATVNPFESNASVYLGAVINGGAVETSPIPPPAIQPNNVGEELLIMTHPNFRDAADTLADWKREKGIITTVFECGTGSGITGRETNEDIDDFIENRYDFTIIKPTYILLMGDAEFIAPFLLPKLNGDPEENETIGTDWPYASRSYPGQEFPTLVPTFALGRIPVDTLDQANTVVNKIIDYEKTPPGSVGLDPFYNTVSLAAQFQCCRPDVMQDGVAQRTFTEVSEFVRDELVDRGYTVERIYTRTIDNSGCPSCEPPRPPYTSDPTPRRYYDGTPISADIGPDSGFSFNGSNQKIINAFNDGRFLILHRDHGYSNGWSNPPFDTTDIPSRLTNGSLLPVVFSINCTSGLFDNETAGFSFNSVYFSETLLREADGGAVGVIGDTRVSPSWPNSALTRGLFDAIWPNTLPGFGGNTSKHRLGDILNHAKLYLITQIGVSGAGVSYGDLLNELYLYHVFGDPTLEIWTSDPRVFTLPLNFELMEFGGESLTIAYPQDGVIITAYQETPNGIIPVGRAEVVDGEVELEYVQFPTSSEPLLLVANDENIVTSTGMVTLPIPQ